MFATLKKKGEYLGPERGVVQEKKEKKRLTSKEEKKKKGVHPCTSQEEGKVVSIS